MSLSLTLPILVPLLAVIGCLLAWRHVGIQRWVSMTGAFAHLAACIWLFVEVDRAGVIAAQMGDWTAPLGITLVADLLGAIMALLTGITGAAVAVYALADVGREREAYGFHPLLHLLLMGVTGAFLTGDIFNLYVWFEVMLLSSFVLLALGGRRGQMEGAIKYVTLNLLSSAVFLAGVGILYGMTGSLNMADLRSMLADPEHREVANILAAMFMVAFGVKAGSFPLFFWLPASYHTPPVAVSAVFSGLLTKVGVYALIRVFTLVFTADIGWTHGVILIAAGLTMLTGVLGAAAQMDIRRILSFHIVSQIGYMMMGLGLVVVLADGDEQRVRDGVALALAGSVFYLMHHIVVKTNLFLIGGVIERERGTGDLKRIGGFWRGAPFLAILFLIPAMSLAGIPPLSGFWAKFVLVRAALELHAWIIVTVALVVGLLTLFSMTKIWSEAFWKDQPDADEGGPAELPAPMQAGERALRYGPIVALAAITVTIGLFPGWFVDTALRSADQLLDPQGYVDTVLAERVGDEAGEPAGVDPAAAAAGSPVLPSVLVLPGSAAPGILVPAEAAP